MRPALRYYGGKWLLAPWIIEHFPPHRVYIEPYAGAASVLLQKPRYYAEIYNDLHGKVVNVFRELRDHGKELERLVRATPFARDEFSRSYEPREDPLEQARRTIVKTFMGFGSDSVDRKSGFRCDSFRSGTTPGTDWRNYADVIPFMVDRLQGVIIENREAIEVMKKNDRPGSLTYVDPPYLRETRKGAERYLFEMDEKDHRELAATLKKCKGHVVLSGYDSPLYRNEGWRTDRRRSHVQHANRNNMRTEILWMNFKEPNKLF